MGSSTRRRCQEGHDRIARVMANDSGRASRDAANRARHQAQTERGKGAGMTVAQERIELADLIEKSQGLICMARGGRIVHLGAYRTSLVVMALRESGEAPVRPVSE